MPFGSRRRTSAQEGVSYSALGSRIEQLLRLAQEQAEQIVAEARAPAREKRPGRHAPAREKRPGRYAPATEQRDRLERTNP
jgi:hypothetical protein